MTLRSLLRRTAILVSLTSAGMILPGAAQARPETLRWTHPLPGSVQRFEAHVRAPDGSASEAVTVPTTTPDGSNIYQTSIEVGSGDKLISLRAISFAGEISAWSEPPQLRADSSTPPDDGGGEVVVGPGIPITPTPGASARYDFGSVQVGDAVPWWIDSRPNFSLGIDDSLFGVVELGSNRVLHTDSTANDIHSHVTGASNVWSDFELRGRMAIDHADAAIGVTTYSQYVTSDVYYRLGRSRGGPFVIEGRPNTLSCTDPTAPVTPQPGDWYRFNFDVQDMGTNNQIRAKVWREGATEPSAYSLHCVDSSAQRPRSGRIGIWSADVGEKFWDDIEVIVSESGGSGGETPPPPPAPPVLIQIVPVAP